MKLDNVPAQVMDTVERELLEGEDLLWVGQPNPVSAAIGPTILRDLSPLLIMGGFFFVFFTIMAREIPWDEFPSQFMLLPLGVVMLTSLWPILSRFLSATRSVYAITDRRALIIDGNNVKSYGPDDIEFIERKMRGQDSGDILFANEISTHYNSSNHRSRVTTRPIGFLGVENVREVEAVMLRTFRDMDDNFDKRKRRLDEGEAIYEDDGYKTSSQRASYNK